MSSAPVGIEWDGGRVSGLLERPANARALLVLAHGAGAGMGIPSWRRLLGSRPARRRHAALSVPLHGARAKRPDTPAVAQCAVRAAVDQAARLAPALPFSPAASPSAGA